MIAQSSTIKFKTVKKYRCDGCQACIFIEPCPACIAKKRLNINIPNQINHAANREKIAEINRRYIAANREKVAEIKRRYYAANREKVADLQKFSRSQLVLI